MHKMVANPQLIFASVHEQVAARMAALEATLDAIAKETVARFCRGNVSIQMGLADTEDELDAKRDLMIARRARAH